MTKVQIKNNLDYTLKIAKPPLQNSHFRGDDWYDIPEDLSIFKGETKTVGFIKDPGFFENTHWGWIYFEVVGAENIGVCSKKYLQLYVESHGQHDRDNTCSMGFYSKGSSKDNPHPEQECKFIHYLNKPDNGGTLIYSFITGRYDGREDDFNQYIEKYPGDTIALGFRGAKIARDRKKEEFYLDAIKDYVKAINLNKDSRYKAWLYYEQANCKRGIAVSRVSSGDEKGAIERYEDAIKDYVEAITTTISIS